MEKYKYRLVIALSDGTPSHCEFDRRATVKAAVNAVDKSREETGNDYFVVNSLWEIVYATSFHALNKALQEGYVQAANYTNY